MKMTLVKISLVFLLAIAVVLGKFEEVVHCPMSNVDIVVFAANAEFPMLYFVLTTMARFVPCSHKVHLFIDRVDVPNSFLWFAENMGNHEITLHTLDLPANMPTISNANGERTASDLNHRWQKLWVDKLIKEDADQSDYIMLLDVNMIFAMPVTCMSLFDQQGRPFHVSVPMDDSVASFFPTCLEMTGGTCQYSYMSTSPFIMPRQAFAPMREHIRRKLNAKAKTLEEAFDHWLQTKDGRMFHPIQVMGEYMRQQHPSQVHQIHCPAWPVDFHASSTPQEVKECEHYFPPALYYDFPVQEVLKIEDPDFQSTKYRSYDGGEFRTVFGSRFAIPTMDMLEMVVDQGDCIGNYLYKHQISNDEGCSEETAKSLHKMLDFYHGKRPLPWSVIEQHYTASGDPMKGKNHLCSQLNKKLV